MTETLKPLLCSISSTAQGGSGGDTTSPVMATFDLPETYDSLTRPILSFTASDDTGVTGYLATESASPPAADDPAWSTAPPADHTFGSAGSQTLYGWAKDAAGNVSTALSDTVTITLNNTMHVSDLDSSVKTRGKSGKWEAFVTVTVHDQNHSPVAGAVISGTWGGDAMGPFPGQVTLRAPSHSAPAILTAAAQSPSE